MPCFLDQVTRWMQNSDGSIGCSLHPHNHLCFHKHAECPGAAVAKSQPTVDHQLQNGKTVLVTHDFSVGGPKSWPSPKTAGSETGLWTITLPGTCTITVTHACDDSSVRKRKKKGEVILEFEADFQRIVVLRGDECHQEALQQLQLSDAGNYWRKWRWDPPGLQRWLACIGFNIFTGRVRKVQPTGDALPVDR